MSEPIPMKVEKIKDVWCARQDGLFGFGNTSNEAVDDLSDTMNNRWMAWRLGLGPAPSNPERVVAIPTGEPVADAANHWHEMYCETKSTNATLRERVEVLEGDLAVEQGPCRPRADGESCGDCGCHSVKENGVGHWTCAGCGCE